MARHLFITESPVVLYPPSGVDTTARFYPGASFTVWTDYSGGTNVSASIKSPDGTGSIDLVANSLGELPAFRGPDGNPDGPELLFIDTGGDMRTPIRAVDTVQIGIARADAAAASAASAAASAQDAQQRTQTLAQQVQALIDSGGGSGGGVSMTAVDQHLGGDATNLLLNIPGLVIRGASGWPTTRPNFPGVIWFDPTNTGKPTIFKDGSDIYFGAAQA